MNAQNSHWLRLCCKAVLALNLAALMFAPIGVIAAMQNGYQFVPEVMIPTAFAWVVSAVMSCGFAFAGLCLADIHSSCRRSRP